MPKKKTNTTKKIFNAVKNPFLIVSLFSIILLSLFILHLYSREDLKLPSIQSISIFTFSIVFLFSAYILIKKGGENKNTFIIIFLISFIFELLIFTSIPLNTEKWADARGYYNLAIFTEENNPLYLIQNYHRLANWNQSFCYDAEARLEKLVQNKMALEYIKGKLQINNPLGPSEYNIENKKQISDSLLSDSSEDGLYKYNVDRTSLHPPGWILILYTFILVFGPYEIVAIIAEFTLTALLVAIVYWFLRKHTNFNCAIGLTFIFILTPALVIYSTAPLMDVPLAIFIILTIEFYSKYIESHNKTYLVLSSFIFSIALLIKFISLYLYLIIFILTMIKKDKIWRFLSFATLSILPIVLLSIFNYYYFLNFLSSYIFTSCFQSTLNMPAYVHFLTHLPNELVIMFSFPAMYYISMGTIKILSKRKITEKEQVLILYIFSFFIFAYLSALAMSRLIFMFSPILLLIATYYVKSFKTKYISFFFVISSLQLLILLILNVLNA